ncbi:NUDIX domain-containing protein [Legionella saoudiensis]|uniref:NUDIX domain-containing protein n=1 Tax=Legionella saoudiensis TaxID=1750561 RepID=UPI00072FCD54|nr:NUDIX domain-containing protein [Legionella saoudiensis]
MDQKIRLTAKEPLHEGYLQVYKYNLEIPSFSPSKKLISLEGREVVHSNDSILVLIYAPLIDSFILCKEFRAGVFCNTNRDDPFILECVSGTIDKNSNPEETAYREVHEESGLVVEHVQHIASVYKSPGLMTEKTHIYYAEFFGTPEEGLHGLKDENEELLTQVLLREKVYMLMDTMKIIDAATLIALYWFRAKYHNKKN